MAVVASSSRIRLLEFVCRLGAPWSMQPWGGGKPWASIFRLRPTEAEKGYVSAARKQLLGSAAPDGFR